METWTHSDVFQICGAWAEPFQNSSGTPHVAKISYCSLLLDYFLENLNPKKVDNKLISTNGRSRIEIVDVLVIPPGK